MREWLPASMRPSEYVTGVYINRTRASWPACRTNFLQVWRKYVPVCVNEMPQQQMWTLRHCISSPVGFKYKNVLVVEFSRGEWQQKIIVYRKTWILYQPTSSDVKDHDFGHAQLKCKCQRHYYTYRLTTSCDGHMCFLSIDYNKINLFRWKWLNQLSLGAYVRDLINMQKSFACLPLSQAKIAALFQPCWQCLHVKNPKASRTLKMSANAERQVFAKTWS